MENPATWTKAERVVQDALDEAARGREQMVFGFSTAQQITNALREAGLLREPTEVSDEG
jgi:hypothetical protein